MPSPGVKPDPSGWKPERRFEKEVFQMGRIYTTGTAYREVPCDAVEIHLRCTVSAKTTAQAIENLLRQSEQLLQTLCS